MQYNVKEIEYDLAYDDMEYYHPPIKNDCKILLVEDSQLDVMLFRKLLERAAGCEDYTIIDTPRVNDIFELLTEYPFDIIFLDLNLNDLSGSACVSAVSAIAPNIPIIVYSGTKDTQLLDEVIMCGAKSYILKGRESPYGIKYMIEQNRIHPQI